MGIQINGNTDTISATDGSLSIAGQELTGVTDINASGIITASQINVGAAITISGGIVTATSFVGDGSGLTGIAGTANVVTDSLVVAGVTTVSAGSTSAPSITPTGDSNTGIFFPSADTIAFGEGGSEVARFDSSGNLGLNETSPSTFNDAGTGGVNFVIGATGTGRGVLTFASEQTGGTDELLGVINFVDSDTTNTATRGARIMGVRGSDANTAYLRFDIPNSGNPVERMRITNNGITKISNYGSYLSTTDYTHEINSDRSGNSVLHLVSRNSSFGADLAGIGCLRSASSGYKLLGCYSGDNSSSTFNDLEFNLRGDGQAYADGSWNGGGADYAEYFEWSDSNPDVEDRRGISVVLDGEKIRPAIDGEDPIGVISGNPSVVGDAAWNKWNGKYLRDDYGTYIQEDYEVEDEDGNTIIQQRRKLNPAYDPDVEYTSREDRPEWDCVGLMGKLRIRKGQPVGARWIKMRDISDTVEEWLVR